jgi:predicted phosphodiesterase
LRENVCVIGDVHGCLNELKELLERVYAMKGKEKTTVIFAGDLVNKGPYSAEVVAYARTMEDAYCVRGNHDDYVIKRGESGIKAQPWEAKLTEEDHRYLKSLPYTITMPSLKAMVVHAGIVPTKEITDQTEFDMMMMRNVVVSDEEEEDGAAAAAAAGGGGLKALIHEEEGRPWAQVWNEVAQKKAAAGESPPHIYFGHDAKRLMQRYEYATGLDTGCCYGKHLSAMLLPTQELVQVQAHAVYEEPGGNKKKKQQ